MGLVGLDAMLGVWGSLKDYDLAATEIGYFLRHEVPENVRIYFPQKVV